MRVSGEGRRPRLLACLAIALSVVAGLTVAAPAATAAKDPLASALAGATVVVTADDVPASDHGTRSFKRKCFGNEGTFADGSRVLYADWVYDVDECFGVAPSGTIWHTWSGASKWYEMRGNGLATNIAAAGEYSNGDRRVVVFVSWASHQYYCQDYRYGSGWTGSWFRC